MTVNELKVFLSSYLNNAGGDANALRRQVASALRDAAPDSELESFAASLDLEFVKLTTNKSTAEQFRNALLNLAGDTEINQGTVRANVPQQEPAALVLQSSEHLACAVSEVTLVEKNISLGNVCFEYVVVGEAQFFPWGVSRSDAEQAKDGASGPAYDVMNLLAAASASDSSHLPG